MLLTAKGLTDVNPLFQVGKRAWTCPGLSLKGRAMWGE